MKKLSEWINDNIRHNDSKDLSHIKDPYFKEKLENGFIRYDPTEWDDLSDLALKDEKELERKGVK